MLRSNIKRHRIKILSSRRWCNQFKKFARHQAVNNMKQVVGNKDRKASIMPSASEKN